MQLRVLKLNIANVIAEKERKKEGKKERNRDHLTKLSSSALSFSGVRHSLSLS